MYVWVHIMEPIRQFEATLVPSSVPLCVCVCVCVEEDRGVGLDCKQKGREIKASNAVKGRLKD